MMFSVWKRFIGAMTLLICLTTANHAQQAGEQKALLDAAREIMDASRYCTLITVTSGGKAEARTMDPLPPDENFTIWLATNPLSQKVSEIRRNPKVTLHYFDGASQAYVAVQGTARIVTSPVEKRRNWKEEWSPFYPDRDRGLLLISVTPSRMEVVNIAKGIVGDTKTWQPRIINIQRSARP